MNALIYIIRKGFKNSLLELLKKPGKLVLYLLIIGVIAGFVILSLFTESNLEQSVPLFWFTAALFLFVTLFFSLTMAKGLSGGDAIFEMNDANLLFPSPVNPRKVLLYGVVRMSKTAFLSSFFVLFQSNSLAMFGVRFDGVLLVFGSFLLSMLVLLTSSLLVYSVTNGRKNRKRAVKLLAFLLFVPLIVFAVSRYLSAPDISLVAEAAAASPFLRYIPVAGWTAAGVSDILSGDLLSGLGFLGLNLLLFAVMIIYIVLSNPDYYEDVLVATETAYELKRAAAEGNINAVSAAGKKAVRVTNTGIPGAGAAAFFGKHLRESLRQSRLGFLSVSSLIISAGAVVTAWLTRDLAVVLQILLWMQIMMIGTGRGLKETFSHYIYLVPESSFKKILWSNLEISVKTLIESVLIFGISGILLGSGAVYIAVCILTYTLFSFLLVGINYLFMRFAGANIGNGLMLLIYYLAVIVVMLPGIAGAIFAGIAVGGDAGYLTGLLVLSGWSLAAGLGCFALARGVLHSCDMAMMKPNK